MTACDWPGPPMRPNQYSRSRFQLFVTGRSRPEAVAHTASPSSILMRHNQRPVERCNHMNLHTQHGLITVADEPTYSFNSADNARSYAFEILLTDDSISSIHGVRLNGDFIVVVGAGGGGSTVHAHSALIIDDRLLMAVGDHVACISLVHPYRLLWSLRVDIATCFGLYWQNQQRALISHGELVISRLSTDGRLIWQASGADIFSEGFGLLPDHVKAVDFNQSVYRFDYATGELLP
ncbi:hypothetical protein D3C77_349990 [compost metagenome]